MTTTMPTTMTMHMTMRGTALSFHDALRQHFPVPPAAVVPDEFQAEAERLRETWDNASRSDMQTIRADCVDRMPTWKRTVFVEILHGIATNRSETDRVRQRAFLTLRLFVPSLPHVPGRRRQRA